LEDNVSGFIGNVEANEIYMGKADCIVCDGYVGNVALKVSEGLMESVGTLMKREIKKNPIAMLGALLLKSSLSQMKKSIDYAEYGGAPLLGVNGLVIIGHGRSSPKAIKNAIRCAKSEIEHNILAKIKEVL
jgi:glycerol-3-phosphate acyltransferase PlsX